MDNELFCDKRGSSSTDAVSALRSVSFLSDRWTLCKRTLLLDWTVSDDMGFWYGCIVIVSVLDIVHIVSVVWLQLGAAMLRFLQKVDLDQLDFVNISFGLLI